MKPISVRNMTNSNYRSIPNQFIISTPEGEYFQSYKTIVAFKPRTPGEQYGIETKTPKIQLDKNAWNYSRTTGKYRNIFLGEKKAETEKKIKSGEYELTDLN